MIWILAMSSINCALRPVTNTDYEFLYDLHVATIRPYVEATWGWDDAVQEVMFRERWDPAAVQVIVVEDEDVGTLRLVEKEDEIFIGLLEIHPDHQNQGVGSTIIAEIVRDFYGDGRTAGLPIRLHVLKANVPARRLYERLGFRIIEDRAERYVMQFQVPLPTDLPITTLPPTNPYLP
jgi:ribosomal protein S18 acetylase RimI-like enzyme